MITFVSKTSDLKAYQSRTQYIALLSSHYLKNG